MTLELTKGRYVCLFLAAVMLFELVLVPVPAASQVAITGSSRQLTTGPSQHYDPAISGNIVSYTATTTGVPQVYFYDLTTNTPTQVTSGANGADSADIFGDTIVYVDYTNAAGGQVIGYSISTRAGSPLAPSATMAQASPGIGGSSSRRIVAWIGNGGTVTFDVFAKDLDSGVVKQITSTSAVESHPNVSGTSIVYASRSGAVSQIFVTDFDTLSTRQLTTTGLMSSPDISGTHVVYQGVPADGNQDIFVYDLATNVETRISLPGVQRNPHVSGDWVAFEDVASGTSAIRLYHIPTGQLFTAVSSTTSNAFLNDIDGTRVAYTGDATGNEQIYLYEFTATTSIPFASFSAKVDIQVASSSFDTTGTFTLGSGGSINPLAQDVTIQVGAFTATIPAGSFMQNSQGFVFAGILNGAALQMIISPQTSTSFAFSFQAAGTVPATANPVTVNLMIGNNTGAVTVNADFL